MSDDIKNAVAEFKALKETFKKEMTEKLKKGFVSFFNTYPEFRSIEWTQYTPYPMDGDPCEFGVGERFYSAQPQFYEDGSWLEDTYSIYDLEDTEPFNRGFYPELDKAWKDFSAALYSIPDEIYLAVFGDHRRIIVTRDGITVEEYEHD